MNWKMFEEEARNSGLDLKVINVPLNKKPTAESIAKMTNRLKPQIKQNQVNEIRAVYAALNNVVS